MSRLCADARFCCQPLLRLTRNVEGPIIHPAVVNQVPRPDIKCALTNGDLWQDAEEGGSVRKALIDLPALPDGIHYLAVTAYLPGFVRAAADLRYADHV